MSAAPVTPMPEARGHIRWPLVISGAFAVVFGGLLLFVPGRTLTFVAVLAGISLCAIGLLDVVRAFMHGVSGTVRAAQLAFGLLAFAAGAIVIARPSGSIKTVAIVAGIYLVVTGLMRIVLAAPGDDRRFSWFRGGLGLAAGILLIVWPDKSVGVLAAIYGLFILALGLAEIWFGLQRDPAPPAG